MRWLILAAALICSQAQAQTLNTLGAGSAAKVSAYQGPGDLGLAGSYAWYSCARAFTAAYAAGGGQLCKIVDTATGATSCIITASTTGFADLTSAVCPTSAPAVSVTTWCTVTNPAGCSVTIAYDQTGNGRDVFAGNSPTITLSALGGLPGMHCASAVVCVLATSGTMSAAQPLNFSTVSKRDADFTTSFPVIGSGSSSQSAMGYSSTTGLAVVLANTGTVTQTASNSAFHAINGVANGASSAINVDGGTDATGTLGTTGISSATLRFMRASGGTSVDNTSMEAGIWQGTAFTQAERQTLSTNQHSAAYGYNF